jgi:two-component system KDP operon response regulator KdpE
VRILVVDDEVQITRVLRASLQSNGYEVYAAKNGVEALEVYLEINPDLVITDLSMPEMNGVELTREIRQRAATPIIVVSVRNQENDKIQALDEGADDYITKPFGIQELLARVRVQLRKSMDHEPVTHIEAGDFEIDADKRMVKVRGAEVHLTPKEFDLLLLFARSPERVLTHKTLLKAIWGPAGVDQPENLRVLVGQLRRKIERDPARPYIETEPWVGYRFRLGD